MRKILWLIAVLLPVGVYGEEMNFLTTLSSPYGVFHTLEATDIGTPTVINTPPDASTLGTEINFGRPGAFSNGKILIYGSESPEFGNIKIHPNSRLKGTNIQEFRIKRIENYTPGVIKGKNLLARRIYSQPSLKDLDSPTYDPATDTRAKLDKIILSVNGTFYTHALRVFGLRANNFCFVHATKPSGGGAWRYLGGSKIQYGVPGNPNNAAPESGKTYTFKWTNKFQLQFFPGIRQYTCSAPNESGNCYLRTPLKVKYDWEFNTNVVLPETFKYYRVPYCPLSSKQRGFNNFGCTYPENVYLLAGQEN